MKSMQQLSDEHSLTTAKTNATISGLTGFGFLVISFFSYGIEFFSLLLWVSFCFLVMFSQIMSYNKCKKELNKKYESGKYNRDSEENKNNS